MADGQLTQPDVLRKTRRAAITTTESGPVSWANHRLLWRSHPVFASNRLVQLRFSPLPASEGLDSGLREIYQPVQVAAGHHHHHHRKVRPRLAYGVKQPAAHLVDDCQHVRAPCAYLGDALALLLLAAGRLRVPMALPLDRFPGAAFLQPGVTPRRRIASVGLDVPACTTHAKGIIEELAVVRADGVGLDLADELVFPVDAHRQLVAEAALDVPLGPGRVDVLMAWRGGFSAGHPAC